MTTGRESRVFEIVAPPEADGERLDRMLARVIPELSRSRIQALMAEGRVTPPARKAAAGQHYRVSIPPPRQAVPAAEAIPLAVIHEDAHLIIVDKPAGMVVHPAPGHDGGTLVNALLDRCGPALTGVGGVARPGIVHRLDKDTSGLIVAAKTETAHAGLRALFEAHDINRSYLALVEGLPSPAVGWIDAPIGRDPRHRKRMAVVERGRAALTHYRVEEAYGARASCVACQLETGRTHQVRVHMAHIGHVLLGDPLYGGQRRGLPAFPRQALHAARLGFRHPVTGEALLFESPPPADFRELAVMLKGLKFER